ncbi:hypothetical protein NDU88_010160 [Pleurodeles waltl]|uniref:Uncharacterized protein n=1 Tax=Pleurodeles waltl TaxID=8319 RepID=A0AAV7QUX5_PLEWA|nr:hypothetical protein NDU88_010160 [Pleurodeles waltl]
MASIPKLEPFVLDGLLSAQEARWKEWVEHLVTYFAAVALESGRWYLKGVAIQKLGKSVVKAGPPFTYTTLKKALTVHFEPLADPDYERFFYAKPDNSREAQKPRSVNIMQTPWVPDDEGDTDDDDVEGAVHVIHAMQPGDYP